MPVLLATQEEKIRKIAVQSQPRHIAKRPYMKKTHHKEVGFLWLKV
jgi:hypothetical protein